MQQSETLDLGTLDFQTTANDGARLDLRHPTTNAPTGAWLQLLGTDSDAYRAAQRTQQRDRLKQIARNRRLGITPEEIEAEALSLLVVATVGLGGFSKGGAALEFSTDAVRGLYTRHNWIREQADEFINDRANFLPKSASSS